MKDSEAASGHTCGAICVKMMYNKLEESGERKKSLESQWEDGLWLGHARRSNEVLVRTKEGVVRAWAVKRLTEDERWAGEAIRTLGGIPPDQIGICLG